MLTQSLKISISDYFYLLDFSAVTSTFKFMINLFNEQFIIRPWTNNIYQ